MCNRRTESFTGTATEWNDSWKHVSLNRSWVSLRLYKLCFGPGELIFELRSSGCREPLHISSLQSHNGRKDYGSLGDYTSYLSIEYSILVAISLIVPLCVIRSSSFYSKNRFCMWSSNLSQPLSDLHTQTEAFRHHDSHIHTTHLYNGTQLELCE